MKTGRWTTAITYPALGAFLLASAPSPVSAHDQEKHVNALVKVVREATERYRDVAVAEADGYALQFGCVTGGEGGGGGLGFSGKTSGCPELTSRTEVSQGAAGGRRVSTTKSQLAPVSCAW